ncbi:hypothetical protein [Rhodococcus sovatensis]|uniref:Orc1-like AAA ATPase domain-containing protein n=1 Tax=Rhodococcus sovatensis TaxID=1805840 RepID=A0ABZ2PG71_9NOCA
MLTRVIRIRRNRESRLLMCANHILQRQLLAYETYSKYCKRMGVSARPLLDNAVDTELFVGRSDEVIAIWSALNSGLNVLVTGDRGIGRTSLMRFVQLDSRDPRSGTRREGDFPMFFVRVEGVADGAHLLRRIVEVVTGEPHAKESTIDSDALLSRLADFRQDLIDRTVERWRRENDDDSITGDRLLPVIIVDDVTASAGHALFGRYRDEVWETGFLWLVAVRSNDVGGLLTPPADTFFEKQIQLGPLTTKERVDLVDRRGGREMSPISETLAETVGGNPRDLVAALRSTFENPDAIEQNVNALSFRDTLIFSLGRSASMLAAELKVRGAVSASDSELLASLGWTRPRAVQVFKQLDDAGLVVSREVSSGQGRPRRMFELTPASEILKRRAESKNSHDE